MSPGGLVQSQESNWYQYHGVRKNSLESKDTTADNDDVQMG